MIIGLLIIWMNEELKSNCGGNEGFVSYCITKYEKLSSVARTQFFIHGSLMYLAMTMMTENYNESYIF